MSQQRGRHCNTLRLAIIHVLLNNANSKFLPAFWSAWPDSQKRVSGWDNFGRRISTGMMLNLTTNEKSQNVGPDRRVDCVDRLI